jgi:hypothetical protein
MVSFKNITLGYSNTKYIIHTDEWIFNLLPSVLSHDREHYNKEHFIERQQMQNFKFKS